MLANSPYFLKGELVNVGNPKQLKLEQKLETQGSIYQILAENHPKQFGMQLSTLHLPMSIDPKQ